MAEKIYSERRSLVFKDKKNEMFIFFSGHEPHLGKFILDRNYYYLSGLTEADGCIVILGGENVQTYFFVRPKDANKEMWDGKRLGVEGVINRTGLKTVFSIESLEDKLPELMLGVKRVHYQWGADTENDRIISSAIKKSSEVNRRVAVGMPDLCDPRWVLASHRFKKSLDEQNLMRENCKLAALAHKYVMQMLSPGMTEKYIQGLLVSKFYELGAVDEAYASIVAGGANATTLHYRENSQVLKDGSLILIDAGSQKNYFAADITRTYPVGKRFSSEQREVYQAVLETQKEVIGAIKVGMKFSDMQMITLRSISEKLVALKLLKGSLDEIIEKKLYLPFYPHGVSHFLGLDVHDLGHYVFDGVPQVLEEGMVFTIEPGIYISEDTNSNIPKGFLGIGVRIEDDILLTQSGVEVMTIDAPKEVSEIEDLRSSIQLS